MAIETSYTFLRNNLAAALDGVLEDQDVLIVRRRGGKDVALIPAAEARRGKPESIGKLRREMGLETGR
jgi:antitoxin YefM